MKRSSPALVLVLIVVVASTAWAKRAEPKVVTPVVHDGVTYVASNNNGREGRVVARGEKSGKKLWEAVVYRIKIDPNLEEDVQWVFITELAIRDNALMVTNEKGEQFLLDLKNRTVDRVSKDDKKR